jgi:hemoglobin
VKRSPHAIYGRVGGMGTFRRLADAFYSRIEQDPILRPMFPRDLVRPRERLALFLAEFFGGPAEYTKKYGKTSLGCRHASFAIGPAEAQAWLGHMTVALEAGGIPEPERALMQRYFDETAPTLADPLLAFRNLTRERLAKCLEQDPALVHRQDGSGRTLLHAASGAWDVDRVTLLLERGAVVEGEPSPLCSVANRYVDRVERSSGAGKIVAELLVQRGAAVNTVSGTENQTPLHIAARRGNSAVALVLLEGGAVLEARDTKGETPLRRAVNCGHLDFVALLLAHGADVNARDKKGRTPLQAARRPDMVALLRAHGAMESDNEPMAPG